MRQSSLSNKQSELKESWKLPLSLNEVDSRSQLLWGTACMGVIWWKHVDVCVTFNFSSLRNAIPKSFPCVILLCTGDNVVNKFVNGRMSWSKPSFDENWKSDGAHALRGWVQISLSRRTRLSNDKMIMLSCGDGNLGNLGNSSDEYGILVREAQVENRKFDLGYSVAPNSFLYPTPNFKPFWLKSWLILKRSWGLGIWENNCRGARIHWFPHLS